MTDGITVYHATGMHSYELMKRCGYVGLNAKDYETILDEIGNTILGITYVIHAKAKKIALMDCFTTSITVSGVSFFPTKEQCIRIAHRYCKGGENKQLILKSYLKSVSRRIKVPYSSMTYLLESYIPSNDIPVILTLRIPRNIIHNADSIGKGVELYTLDKISAEYIVSIHKDYNNG